jgi:hypothetical protein
MQINEAIGFFDDFVAKGNKAFSKLAWDCIRKELVEGQKPTTNNRYATPVDIDCYGLLSRWCLDMGFNPTPDQLRVFVNRLNAACGTSHS